MKFTTKINSNSNYAKLALLVALAGLANSTNLVGSEGPDLGFMGDATDVSSTSQPQATRERRSYDVYPDLKTLRTPSRRPKSHSEAPEGPATAGAPDVHVDSNNNIDVHLHGLGEISEQAQLALEMERTRQAQIAADEKLKTEHERNKWFNSMVQYLDTRLAEETQKGRDLSDENKAFATKMLDKHHGTLDTLITKKAEHDAIQLPKLLAHDLTKTSLLHAQAMEKWDLFRRGVTEFTSDRKRMQNVSLTITAAALGIYGAKRGTKVAADYFAKHLMQPELVSNTSRLSLTKFLHAPVATLLRKSGPELPEVICNPELQAELDTYIASIKQGRTDGQPYRHALFHGEPGTGKTLLAQRLARTMGMEFAELPAANIGQYDKKTAIEQVNKLFQWSNSSRKGTVLFIDECDAMAPKRTGDTSEQARSVLNCWLAHTGSEMHNTLVIGATNAPGLLDAAFLSRMDEKIYFDKPNTDTRTKLLQQYFDRYVKADGKIVIAEDAEQMLPKAAQKIAGFAGRDISQLARAIRAKAATTPDRTVTAEIIDSVTAQKIAQSIKLSAHAGTTSTTSDLRDAR